MPLKRGWTVWTIQWTDLHRLQRENRGASRTPAVRLREAAACFAASEEESLGVTAAARGADIEEGAVGNSFRPSSKNSVFFRFCLSFFFSTYAEARQSLILHITWCVYIVICEGNMHAYTFFFSGPNKASFLTSDVSFLPEVAFFGL